MEIGLIGINKYAKYLNFACDLHIYAFQQFLSQNGYSSTILDYKPVYYGNFDMRYPAKDAERKYREAVKKKSSRATLDKLADMALGYRTASAERERRLDKFEAFVKDRLKFTEEQYDSDLLEVEDPGFDCYICVTDVIWQSLAKHDFDRGFLLGSKAFEGKQKIAYAASRGASKDFNDRQEALFFEYLDDIDTITVRERDFGEYIEAKSDNRAPLVLDPVLLHDRSFWDEVAVKPSEERYVALYYVMEQASDTIDKAVEYAKLHDLTVVELSDRPFKYGKVTDPDVKHVSRYDVGMEEWLGYIQNAEAVFTNSFHGCCFSLLFEKTFFAGRRNGQKVPNFLATFGLDAQRFGAESDINSFSGDIDYTHAKSVLGRLRQESSDFILHAIGEAESRFNSGQAKDTSQHERRRQSLTYPVRFHSGQSSEDVQMTRSKAQEVSVTRLKSGGLEYHVPTSVYANDGETAIDNSRFTRPGHQLDGWTLRFRIDNRWFWLLDDGSIAPSTTLGSELDDRKLVIKPGDKVPHLPVNKVSMVVFTARWSEARSFVSRLKIRAGMS
ncbi:polysaccharide pyruvyl transferase family protein [Brevibacterium sp. K11IcPPYGO002]|uniref:polysaccharide pyruvyl transferase family protein n=1 Tax=Brevibacterium sp. K11IcPPYGO002 TaxID=3058837 RepID=UPI003D8138AA